MNVLIYYSNISTNCDTGETTYKHYKASVEYTKVKSILQDWEESYDGETRYKVNFICDEITLEPINEERFYYDEDDDSGCDDCTNYAPSQWREMQRGY